MLSGCPSENGPDIDGLFMRQRNARVAPDEIAQILGSKGGGLQALDRHKECSLYSTDSCSRMGQPDFRVVRYDR